MLPFLRIPETPDEDVVAVDCPSCPVNLSCLTQSETQWRFDCCGSAALAVRDGTVLIDCQINAFKGTVVPSSFTPCPLCTGGIMEAVELARSNPGASMSYYLPTVHAKFPITERLASLRRRHQEALAWAGETKEG
jgi:hypothetical protein